MKTSLLFLAGLVAIAAQLSFVPASAATEMIPVDVSADAPDTVSLSLPGFNEDLGTLTGITFSIVVNDTSDLVVTDASGSAQTFTDGETTTTFKLVGPDNLTVLSHTFVSSLASDTVPSGVTRTYPLTDTAYMSPSTALADLSAYEVVGTKDIPFALSLSALYSGTPEADNVLFFSGSSEISGQGSIQYLYTPFSVPEPSTWALLLGGLALLAPRRRQRDTLSR